VLVRGAETGSKQVLWWLQGQAAVGQAVLLAVEGHICKKELHARPCKA
jgi:hypothetical protein